MQYLAPSEVHLLISVQLHWPRNSHTDAVASLSDWITYMTSLYGADSNKTRRKEIMDGFLEFSNELQRIAGDEYSIKTILDQ